MNSRLRKWRSPEPLAFCSRCLKSDYSALGYSRGFLFGQRREHRNHDIFKWSSGVEPRGGLWKPLRGKEETDTQIGISPAIQKFRESFEISQKPGPSRRRARSSLLTLQSALSRFWWGGGVSQFRTPGRHSPAAVQFVPIGGGVAQVMALRKA